MTCPQCGYVMAPFEKSCPRCTSLKQMHSQHTAPDSKTQFLVQLEHCPRCNWFLFPADTVCSSCGAPVVFAEQDPLDTPLPLNKAASRPSNEQILAGLLFGAAMLCVAGLLFYFWRHG
jgi:hypothetical protein